MAELSGAEDMFRLLPPIPARAQLAAVAWLRWQIFVNGIFRRRPRNKSQAAGLVFAILLRLIVWPMMTMIVVGPVVGSGYLAWAAAGEGSPRDLGLLLLGITLLWQFFGINGFSISAATQSFDPASLIRFPLRFGRYFVLRSLLGLLTPSSIVGCLALLAAAMGIGAANPSLAAPAFAAMAIYAAMNIYLTRMIGAWMKRWLTNRRFREIFSVMMVLPFAALQFLDLQRPTAHGHGVSSTWLLSAVHGSGPYVYWLPPGFAAQAVLLPNHPLAMCGQFALLLASAATFAALFAIRLKKQFHGEYLSEGPARRASANASVRAKMPAVESAASPATAGLFSPTLAACLRKDWIVLRGNSTQLIGMLAPLLLVAIFSMNRTFSHYSSRYFLPAAIAYALIGVLSSLYNAFGADGRGAQIYLLAPIRTSDVVIAKNLMSLVLIVAEAGLVWIAVCTLARTPIPLPVQVSTALWAVFVVALNLAIGNLRSIQAPRYFVPGQTRQPRGGIPTNRTSALLILAVVLGSLFLQIPVGIASSYFGLPWLGAWLYAPFAAVALFAYVFVLRNIEQLILAHRDVFAEELSKA